MLRRKQKRKYYNWELLTGHCLLWKVAAEGISYFTDYIRLSYFKSGGGGPLPSKSIRTYICCLSCVWKEFAKSSIWYFKEWREDEYERHELISTDICNVQTRTEPHVKHFAFAIKEKVNISRVHLLTCGLWYTFVAIVEYRHRVWIGDMRWLGRNTHEIN